MDYTKIVRKNREQLIADIYYSPFDFMRDCSFSLRQQLRMIWESVFDSSSGVALFAYGSLARAEFMDNSDVDILVVHDHGMVLDNKLQLFMDHCAQMQYDKIDIKIAEYQQSSFISPNLILADCAYSANYLCGDESFSTNRALVDQPNHDWQLTRMLFSSFYLDDYFSILRSSADKPNLKYARGASRDSIFINWFVQYLGFHPIAEGSPHIDQALDWLNNQLIFSGQEIQIIRQAIGVLAVLKNEGLHLNRGKLLQGRAWLDSSMQTRLLHHLSNYLTQYDIYSTTDLLQFFWQQCSIVTDAKQRCLKYVSRADNLNQDTFQIEDDKTYRTIFNNGGVLLKLEIIWLANRYKRQHLIAILCDDSIYTQDWTVLASLCCSPYATSTFLEHIGRVQVYEQQDDYLARFIIANPNTSSQILQRLSNYVGLSHKYRKLAKIKCRYHTAMPLENAGEILFTEVS